jgi:hypothetical protein
VTDTAKVGCHGCGATNEVPAPVSRRETCNRCGADLHCCLSCVFHDRSAYNECREPSAERVVDKDRSNFCDYYAPKVGAVKSGSVAPPAVSDLERLFAKKK